MNLRKMIPDDWESVKDIYLQGIDTGNATFQKDAPSKEEWDKTHLDFSRTVSVNERNEVTVWCALSAVSPVVSMSALQK